MDRPPRRPPARGARRAVGVVGVAGVAAIAGAVGVGTDAGVDGEATAVTTEQAPEQDGRTGDPIGDRATVQASDRAPSPSDHRARRRAPVPGSAGSTLPHTSSHGS